MPEPKFLSDEIAVCAFVPPERVAELAPHFGTLINNRPDFEEPGQPTSAEIEAEARRLGLDYVHIPIVPGHFTDQDVAAFSKAVAEHARPVLAFCRSGARATAIWAISQAGKRNTAEILKAAAAAGFDSSDLKPRLEEKAARG